MHYVIELNSRTALPARDLAHASEIMQKWIRLHPALDWKICRTLPTGYTPLDTHRLKQASDDFIWGDGHVRTRA